MSIRSICHELLQVFSQINKSYIQLIFYSDLKHTDLLFHNVEKLETSESFSDHVFANTNHIDLKFSSEMFGSYT